MNKIQITPEIKVSELLQAYPELEDRFIEIVPSFNKMKNSVIRNTLGKVTTLRQVSKVGEVSLPELLNQLRLAVGQEEIVLEENKSAKKEIPSWVKEANIKITYDARADLENGVHPVDKVIKEILTLNENEIYCLITPFFPGPLVEIVKEKGFESYSLTKSTDEVHTFIKKKL